MRLGRQIRTLAVVLAALCAGAPAARAANPPAGAVTPDASGGGMTTWTGAAQPGSETLLADEGRRCFGGDGRPVAGSGCDVYALEVAVPANFYADRSGAVNVTVDGFGLLADLDLYIYKRNADGTRGDFVTGDGQTLGVAEGAAIDKAAGLYYVVVTPYTTLGAQTYNGRAVLVTRKQPSRAELEQAAPPGVTNYRASHDTYTSHSEPMVAMDPLDHDHLMAGSKMYENNDKYLFKIGTYESKDGGRTWEDQGMLPGYCQAPGQCDPGNEAAYRTTSDVSIAFDDEGNAYANVLDAPGGTFAFMGFNMTVHVKRPGQPWSGPTVVHDNRVNELTSRLFLDDKNWIAVDNHTDVRGGPNAPDDGKIGTMYICWSFDGTLPVANLQQIVVMRSLDGGKTWGGIAPGDNIPYPVSLKTYISGIGCHLAIGPRGEVYATWYDNQLNALMQAKSTNRGATWSLPVPIAGISGIDEPFAGEAFRNLSLPSTAVDNQGNVYVVASSSNAEGRPLLGNPREIAAKMKSGELEPKDVLELLSPGGEEEEKEAGREIAAGGDGAGPGSGSDVVLFKSTNGGRSYSGPIRVNQDPPNGDGDQFQPSIAVTPSGQVDISYFDRRNDPSNTFIDTWLSQSEDGGRTFTDHRVSQRMWDPAINAPTSTSGKFIGDYQGLVADDEAAIPFWNDTQLASLAPTDPAYSPYQEVFAARYPGDAVAEAKSRCFPRRLKVFKNAIGRLALRAPRDRVGRRFGPPARTARGVLRYCATGGGRVFVAFSTKGTVQFAATTAKGHRRLGIGKGSTERALRHAFGRRVRSAGSGVRRIRGGLSQQVLFGVRRGRVTFVAVANTSLIADRRALRRQLRRAGLVRAR